MSDSFQKIDMDEFSSYLLGKKGRLPLTGLLEPTFRCNLQCAHCYVSYDPKERELTCEEFCRIIDQIVEAGCLQIAFTGGEPFLREDFLDIYSYAKSEGLIITLFTNGTLITEEIADFLHSFSPFSVEISLHGVTPGTYEKVTRTPGSFQRCVRGINLLLERDIRVKLKTVVLNLNYQELEGIKEYVEGLGLEFLYDPYVMPKLDGSKEPYKFSIPPEETVKLEIADKKRYKAWMKTCQRFQEEKRSDKLFTCGAGLNSFVVNPYGKLQMCIAYRNPSYDLLEGTFSEGFQDFFMRLRSKKISDKYPCLDCDHLFLCQQCPGWSQLENGDPELPVKYLCEVAKLHASRLENVKYCKKRKTNGRVIGNEKRL
jgi:radical SAM protein with 4Fe4S-binding SPASM domain